MSRIEVTSDQLERRWFAAHNACVAQRRECDLARQSLDAAELAWSRCYARLRTLETLRDSLGQTLAEEDAGCERATAHRILQVVSAA